MEGYKITLKIAAFLLEYPDAAWRKDFPEYCAAAAELKTPQSRDVFLHSPRKLNFCRCTRRALEPCRLSRVENFRRQF